MGIGSSIRHFGLQDPVFRRKVIRIILPKPTAYRKKVWGQNQRQSSIPA